jgi:hypothetical protein
VTELRVGDVLRVDGDERIAPPARDHLRAKTAKNPRQDVAPDRGVLVDENASSRESVAWKRPEVARHVSLFCGRVDGRQRRWAPEHSASVERAPLFGLLVLLGPDTRDLRRDSSLVGLEDLADAFVELDAVSIEGDVTAAHHHAGAPHRHRVKDHRRSGDLAGILDGAPAVEDGLGASDHDPIRARPKIAGQDNGGASLCVSDAEEIRERPFDVDVRLEVRDVANEATQPARPEGERDGDEGQERGFLGIGHEGQGS